MRILGVDTSTTSASVALIEDDQLIAEAGEGREHSIGLISARGNHSETVLPMIQAVLDKSDCRLADLTAIAIAIGPGSFTGLRIGLALVKGLAYDGNLPVIGVPSLEAQAERVRAFAGLICPLLDARKEEVYTAVFDRRDGILRRRFADRACAVTTLATLFDPLPSAPAIAFIGAGAERYCHELLRLFAGRAQLIGETDAESAAHALARLALRRFADAPGGDLGQLVPFYLSSFTGLGNTPLN
ncbi:MAG TPA: tRNA (adenosine(37)-N6)-threonylcarbamoyltransferase complex dimerization subunit type 1 TsaB [Candidatus Limnocylindria bacterium]|nr:tRNA (adenosine(37)-N6)-threonylcarbamoyltransferase complex dimerization subunit type 1 TsaB [Candidatus Limnocylindria bacterium]